MNEEQANRLVIAISSRALFDLSDSHKVYTEQGLQAFQEYQIANENKVLEKGEAFTLVEKLLAFNKLPIEAEVEVILLSRNSADTGLRVFNSIEHYGLDISRAAFCSGNDPHRYVSAFNCDLFLSSDPQDVRQALKSGVAAATLFSPNKNNNDSGTLRIAFDGDAVLFSDESERVYKEKGLQAFTDSEKEAAKKPMSDGPFVPFLRSLNRLQQALPLDQNFLRTALVTARAAPAHERVIRTLREWNIRIDESIFLGGLAKGPFLASFEADIFFDDQQGHVDSARDYSVSAGHVPHGIANE